MVRQGNHAASESGQDMLLTQEEASFLRKIARGRLSDPTDRKLALVQKLLSSGALAENRDRLSLTADGKQALRRFLLAREEDNIFGDQHRDLGRGEASPLTPDPESIKAHKTDSIIAKVNHAESPLLKLARKCKADGSSYLDVAQLQAGERLRADFERGQIAPQLGINWSRLGETAGSVSKKARLGQVGEGLAEGAVAAQERFRAALADAGEEFADPLIDFCCFLKGLEEIERTRNWPARSAKQILSMALARLARHYGLSQEARGTASRRIHHWGEEGYRPKII